jgi:hypothetical protein
MDVYECLVVDKSQRKFASETFEGSEPLSRAEVEKLPKFVTLLAGTLTLQEKAALEHRGRPSEVGSYLRRMVPARLESSLSSFGQ